MSIKKPTLAPHAVDSLACAQAQPNRLLHRSTEAGWTSMLVDHLEGMGSSPVFDTHPTADLTLVVATAGRHQVSVCKRGQWDSTVYEPGVAGLTASREVTRLRWKGLDSTPFRTAHIYLPQSLLQSVAEEFGRPGGKREVPALSVLAFRDPVVASCTMSLLQAMRARLPNLYADQAAQWLATHLLAHHAALWDPLIDRRCAPVLTDRRLARAMEYMSAHLGDELTVDSIARAAGISAPHFARLFRTKTGITPFSCLTELRMQSAARLLKTTELSVAAIAGQCGYVRATAFAVAFARHAGESPTRFRRGHSS